jgi:phosphoglycolate phosphatase-like HAD superfamily hydrolase
VVPSSWEAAIHITDAGVVDWLWRRYRERAPTAEELEAFADAYAQALSSELQRAPDRFRVMQGAPALLDLLHRMQWDVAIATGAWRRLARLKLEAAGISEELLLATSDDAMDRREIFRLAQSRAVEKRGAPHSGTVLVGDGVWDVRVAAGHGWRFLGVGKGQRAERLRAEGATAVVEDFSDLVETLNLLQRCGTPLSG